MTAGLVSPPSQRGIQAKASSPSRATSTGLASLRRTKARKVRSTVPCQHSVEQLFVLRRELLLHNGIRIEKNLEKSFDPL